MSAPYVYKPTTPTHYASQFQHTPYYANSPRPGTPFIPDSAMYPSSPYSQPNSLAGSPNRSSIPLPSSANRYPFPATGYDAPYEPWPAYHHHHHHRPRRPSWHGVPQDDPWLTPASAYPPGYNNNHRRHSFGAAGHQAPFANESSGSYAFYMNPWINAESPRPDFYFDLALPAFTPLRLYGPGHSDLLPSEEMVQPATHPPTTQIRIICDALPKWPFDLQLDPYHLSGGYQAPPITLSDVLVAIHRNLHKQISHADWAELNETEEIAISRAFTKRCKAIPTTFESERAKGVKRVDYLVGRTKLVGLIRIGKSDGWEIMKMIVV